MSKYVGPEFLESYKESRTKKIEMFQKENLLENYESVLKNILETLQVEKEMMAKSPTQPKPPNKETLPSLLGKDTKWKKQQKLDLKAAKDYMGGWKNLTILELEEGNK